MELQVIRQFHSKSNFSKSLEFINLRLNFSRKFKIHSSDPKFSIRWEFPARIPINLNEILIFPIIWHLKRVPLYFGNIYQIPSIFRLSRLLLFGMSNQADAWRERFIIEQEVECSSSRHSIWKLNSFKIDEECFVQIICRAFMDNLFQFFLVVR